MTNEEFKDMSDKVFKMSLRILNLQEENRRSNVENKALKEKLNADSNRQRDCD